MKKILFLCIMTLVMLSCTSPIATDPFVHPELDGITTLVLNSADSTVMQACIVVDDQVIVLPKYTSDDAIVLKNYNVGATIVLTVMVGFFIGLIAGLLIAYAP